MLKINPKCRLPYNIVKGSVNKRRAEVKMLNCDLFDRLYAPPRVLNIKNIRKNILGNIKKRTGIRNLPINIKKHPTLEYGAYAATTTEFDPDTGYYTYELEFPFKKGELNIKDLCVVLHEATHLHDYLFNPRIMVRQIKVLQGKGKFRNKLNTSMHKRVYENIIYTRLANYGQFDKKLAKAKLFIYTLFQNKQEKLDNLQLCRYRLLSEIFAYSESEKYADIMKKRGYNIFKCATNSMTACFDEKLSFLEDEIKSLIASIRESNRNSS